MKEDVKMREYISSKLDDKFKDMDFSNYWMDGAFNYDNFFSDLVGIYEEVVGRREVTIHNNPGFIPLSIRNKIKKYNKLKRCSRFKKRSSHTKKLLNDMDKDIKKSLSEYKQKRWGQFCASISDTTDAKEFWSLIKKVQNCKKIQVNTVERKMPDGSVTSDPDKVMKIDAQHYESLANESKAEGERYDQDFKQYVQEELGKIRLEEGDTYDEVLDSEFTVEEVGSAIASFKNHKAPGYDGITNELLKLSNGPNGLAMFTLLMNEFWKREIIPLELKRGRIFNIFKEGDPTDCNNYRGITLLSVIYKLLTLMMNRRMIKFCGKNNIIEEQQGGFREARGCMDQLTVLYKIVEKRLSLGKTTILAFIDFRKAFDKVWRDGLFFKLYKSGVRGKMFRVIQECYRGTKSSVLVNGMDSKIFDINGGVPQGDPSSPTHPGT
eukprot:Awhi_evm1s15203